MCGDPCSRTVYDDLVWIGLPHTKPSRSLNCPLHVKIQDLVSHCGGTVTGSYISSLVVTDVCSGWTEAIPLLAREQTLVVTGLEAVSRLFPVPIRGINSDNDSVFINETLLSYCEDRGIAFTRSRAYRKNDQAWIEQKNGSVVRRFVGHERYSGPMAGQTMAHLYGAMRLYVNHFQPSFQLLERSREGGDSEEKIRHTCNTLRPSAVAGRRE